MKLLKRIPKPLLITAAALLITFAVYVIHGNGNVGVTELSISSDKLPKSFDGYRIAHISDLHCAKFGKNNQKLLDMLEGIAPDIIVITGDLIDTRYDDEAVGIDFAKSAAVIAPTYFVSGNHEIDNDDFDSIAAKLQSVGVTVLRGESVRLYKSDEYITLVGIDDARVITGKEANQKARDVIEAELEKLPPVGEEYTILLAHRPDMIELYANKSYDLVFSGHAHGGQFRLPFIGGLYAPGQGLFPEYTEGIHTVGNTNLVISRGLGNASFPFRINNNPEIVALTLKCE
ncbi:MAG: metallophosphoesterase [Clostridia bacterium]|nr:metallophosphoesterase [Clostridia bacterium]